MNTGAVHLMVQLWENVDRAAMGKTTAEDLTNESLHISLEFA